jgi:Glycosyltransferases involved in cell wall biogenesis
MDNQRPRVSVGLPVFNGEKYLAKALDSLLAQEYEDFELIISDNASTDETGRICEKYARQDGRIRYWRNPSNIGLARTTIEYLRSPAESFSNGLPAMTNIRVKC